MKILCVVAPVRLNQTDVLWSMGDSAEVDEITPYLQGLIDQGRLKVEGAIEAAGAEPVNLSRMNKAQLIAYAEAQNIDVDPAATNAAIREAIEAEIESADKGNTESEEED